MPMHRAGAVVRTAQGLAIVRCPNEDHVRIGAQIVDESLDTIGRVVDVFGPVERPYLAVTTGPDISLPALLGTKLYAR
jgi:RNA-binding protein